MDDENTLAAAKAGVETAFRSLLDPLTHELRVFAYRMLGSFADAEDALQETRLKAWRGLAGYEPHASFKAWTYRILTNTCLDMLRTRARRVLPPEVGAPVQPGPPTTEVRHDIAWLEPYPDHLLPAADPSTALRLRESVRLAFVRALQVLPARQRAALILHDVLDWTAQEVAAALETTVAAINSALQRARATIAAQGGTEPVLDAAHAEAVRRYLHAWETGNFVRFAELLAHDAILSMPPWLYWLDGRDAVLATLTSPATWEGLPRAGRYRMKAVAINGQPAALAYLRTPEREVPVCLTTLALDGAGEVSDLTIFVLPLLFETWGYST